MGTPADEAKKFERFANSKKFASRSARNISIRNSLLEKAAEGYENARKYWLQEAEQNSSYPRKVHYAEQNAKHNYELAEQVKRKIYEEESGLQKRLFGLLSITALLIAFVLVSFNLTGNVIGNISLNDTRWIGVCFFLCGLVLAFIYLRKKK